ncbi:hypothetical protein BDR03DRAFT_1016564 [Suillus americanus]|nr:hypothetical protein BDR03DRAFT_1016564 [Suillus americanus]
MQPPFVIQAASLSSQKRRINSIPPPTTDTVVPDAPIIDTPARMPCPPAPTAVDPDTILVDDKEVGFSQVLANLIIVEVACLSVQSDTHCNHLTPGYDLKIPPAAFDKVM